MPMTSAPKRSPQKSQESLKTAVKADIFAVRHSMLGESEQVPFGRLQIDPVRFQVRNLAANTFINKRLQAQQSEDAIDALAEVLATGHTLDPIIVWQEAGSEVLWVVDGHHRMSALRLARTKPDASIWVQRFTGETEADARRFALSLNKRTNVNMTKDEVIQELWVMMLCGEVTGSARSIAATYGVSKSTVGRMKQNVEHIRDELERKARAEEVELTLERIRSEPPIWRELSGWREEEADEPLPHLDPVVMERIAMILANHLTDEAVRHPEELREAVRQFALELRLDWVPGWKESPEDDF